LYQTALTVQLYADLSRCQLTENIKTALWVFYSKENRSYSNMFMVSNSSLTTEKHSAIIHSLVVTNLYDFLPFFFHLQMCERFKNLTVGLFLNERHNIIQIWNDMMAIK